MPRAFACVGGRAGRFKLPSSINRFTICYKNVNLWNIYGIILRLHTTFFFLKLTQYYT